MKFATNARKTTVIICTVIFAIMLFLNCCTPYVVDDFTYLYNFADLSRIENLGDVVESMIAHYNSMNGRTVAHALMQISTLLPRFVFDICNSLVFLAMILLIAKIGMGKDRSGYFDLLIVMVFCAIWLYLPDFGQCILWQDGAFNYLWGVVANLLLIIPFINECIYQKHRRTPPVYKAAFLVLALLAGAYIEGPSLASIVMAILLLAWNRFFRKQKTQGYLVAALVAACLGFLTMFLSPAQWANKSDALSLGDILASFASVTTEFRALTPLLISLTIFTVLMVMDRVDINTIALCGILFLGALAGLYYMIFAKYYVARAIVATPVLLTAANAVALHALLEKGNYRKIIVCMAAVLILMTVPALIEGGWDVVATGWEIAQNEENIISAKEAGVTEVEVPSLTTAQTKYSAVYGITYVNKTDPDSYPNDDMARYYGVDKIIGK